MIPKKIYLIYYKLKIKSVDVDNPSEAHKQLFEQCPKGYTPLEWSNSSFLKNTKETFMEYLRRCNLIINWK